MYVTSYDVLHLSWDGEAYVVYVGHQITKHAGYMYYVSRVVKKHGIIISQA